MEVRKPDSGRNNPTSPSHPRSRRSQTNLSNLRLAPLSTEFDAKSSVGSTGDLGYQSFHSSYIQGKSAPSTPGILGRTSSRHQLSGGLSRKLSLYDTSTPSYAAVEVNRDGVPLNALRPDVAMGTMPKAKSEAALPSQRRSASRMQAQLSQHSGSKKHHQRSQTGSRVTEPKDGDWLTRTGLATTSLLRESKGQSWLASTSYAADDSESDDDRVYSRLSASAHQRMHFADDELSPETPRYASRWGSRFGSRAPSARNSRRGSIDLARTPTVAVSQDDYFDDYPLQHHDAVKPDFVDADEDSDPGDAEEEIARLARERTFGFGGLVDRLVGWSLFKVDEEREATDAEDEDPGRPRRKANDATPAALVSSNIQAPVSTARDAQSEAQEEGGWHDAAWLLSLASKIIL